MIFGCFTEIIDFQHKVLREQLSEVEKRVAAKSLDVTFRKNEIEYEENKKEVSFVGFS